MVILVLTVTTLWITSSAKLTANYVISQDALTVGLSQHALTVMKAGYIIWIQDHACSVTKGITSSKTPSVRSAN